MFERFTERAVRIIMAAQSEAKRLGSDFVGAEHLLMPSRTDRPTNDRGA